MFPSVLTLRTRCRAATALFLMPLLTITACGGDALSPEVPTVASVSITPVEDEIAVGESRVLGATVKTAEGAVLEDRAIQWISENSTVATVTQSGLLEARASGVAGIKAVAEGKSARIEVRVRALPPAPALTGTEPAELLANATPTMLTVLGANFTATSVIEWNGLPRNTLFISATELRVPLSIADTRYAGAGLLRVRTPAPGGGSTALLSVPIVAPPAPAPAIARLAPSEILAGSATDIVVTIIGTGFTASSRVYVNEEVREADYFGPTTLRFILRKTELVAPRLLNVRVETPAPGGGDATATLRLYEIPVARLDVDELLNPFGASWLWTGWPAEFKATPFSALGIQIPNRRVTWGTTTPTHLQLFPESDNLVRIFGTHAGEGRFHATLDQITTSVNITTYDVPQYDIVYSTGTGENQHLRIWSPWQGNGPRPLLTSLIATDPAPSPDGQWVAFTGTPKGQCPVCNPDIYVVRRDGTELRRLTTHEGIDLMPAWSPNGQRLAYVSSRATGTLDIWTMDVNGGDQRQLTTSRTARPVSGSGTGSTAPAWSPDGSRLAYVVGVNTTLTLWTMAADGTDKLPLTSPTGANDNFPSWSPDGQFIIFERHRPATRGYALMAVSPDGLPEFPFRQDSVLNASRPSYSPDGRWIISTTSNRDAPSELYAMPSNGEKAQRIMLSQELLGARHARWMRKP